MSTCLLCCEDIKYHGIGKCNHNEICHLCHIKCREKTKNNKCSICNVNLDTIVIARGANKVFSDFNVSKLIPYKDGIYFESEEIQTQCDNIDKLRCFFSNCNDSSTFSTMIGLKEHLHKTHSRYLCEVCLNHRALVLHEQQLYSKHNLNKHLDEGDYDKEGTLVFLHPKCEFCNKHYYDEDSFLKHLQIDHFKCSLCGDGHKYRWYNKYQDLQIHYNMSHYACKEQICLEKCFIAFTTKAELDLHNSKAHPDKYKLNKNKTDMTDLTGFYYGHSEKREAEAIQIMDKAGIYVENQLLSLRKEKTHIQTDREKKIWKHYDPREFLTHLTSPPEESGYGGNRYGGRGGRGNRGKGYHNNYGSNNSYYDKRGGSSYTERGGSSYAERGGSSYTERRRNEEESKNEVVYFEDLRLVKLNDIFPIDRESFERKLKSELTTYVEQNLRFAMNEFLKNKDFKPQDLVKKFIESFGVKKGFRYAQEFIGTIQKREMQALLDKAILDEATKLPSKYNLFLLSAHTFQEVFEKLKSFSLEAVYKVCEKSELSFLHKEGKLEQQRVYQLSESMRATEPNELIKLKFLNNFLSSIEVGKKVQSVFEKSVEEVKEIMINIPLKDLLFTYFYFDQAAQKFAGNSIKLEYSKIPKDYLGFLLSKNKELCNKIKYNIDETIPVPSLGHSTSQIAQDKWEFPTMQKMDSSVSTSKNQTSTSNTHHQKKKHPNVGWQEDFSEIQKNINRDFPALPDTLDSKFDKSKIQEARTKEKEIKTTLNITGKTGWGSTSTATPNLKYESNVNTGKKTIDEDFPTLGGLLSNNDINNEEKDIWEQKAERDKLANEKSRQPKNQSLNNNNNNQSQKKDNLGAMTRPKNVLADQKSKAISHWEDEELHVEEEKIEEVSKSNAKKEINLTKGNDIEDFPTIGELISTNQNNMFTNSSEKDIFEMQAEKERKLKELEWVPAYKLQQQQNKVNDDNDPQNASYKKKKKNKKKNKSNLKDIVGVRQGFRICFYFNSILVQSVCLFCLS